LYKIGDKVLFSLNGQHQYIKKDQLGIVLKVFEMHCTILHITKHNGSSIYQNIGFDKIEHISNRDKVQQDLMQHYDSRVAIQRLMMMVVTNEMKEDERVRKYNHFKQQIINTAKNMIASEDDTDFENKLKAISELKKHIFTIELDILSEIRKYNGRIGYNIKLIENERKRSISDISDDAMQDAFSRLD